MIGPAITIAFAPTNGSHHFTEAPYVHIKIIEQALAGDVIVMAAGGSQYGFWGDQMNARAIRDGLAGAVVDGACRDSGTLRQTQFPVFARSTTFESFVPYMEPVGYNTPVQCGDALVRAGDIVVGDDDGALVIPAELLPEVVRGAEMTEELENWISDAKKHGADAVAIYDRVKQVTREISELRSR